MTRLDLHLILTKHYARSSFMASLMIWITSRQVDNIVCSVNPFEMWEYEVVVGILSGRLIGV